MDVPRHVASGRVVRRGEGRLFMTPAGRIGACAGAAALVALTAVFDARIAAAAHRLSPATVGWAQDVIGLRSISTLAGLSGALAVAIPIARRLAPSRDATPALDRVGERAMFVFLSVAASSLLADVVKRLVGRARPALMETFGPYHFELISLTSSQASFPSIHAAVAFAVAVAFGIMLPRCRVAFCGAACLFSMARVIANVQYASDVLAGAALGIFTTLVMAHLFAQWSPAVATGEAQARRHGLRTTTLRGRTGAP